MQLGWVNFIAGIYENAKRKKRARKKSYAATGQEVSAGDVANMNPPHADAPIDVEESG